MAALVTVSCRETQDDPSPMDSETSGTTEDEGGDAADPNLSDEACARAGGVFGIIATHDVPLAGIPEERHRQLEAPGLAFGPGGLAAAVWSPSEGGSQDSRGYRLRFGLDGNIETPPEPIDDPWAGGRWWPGPSGVVVTHCNAGVPGWTFVDQAGRAVGPAAHPEQRSGCFRPPSASWVSDSEALIAWFDTEVGCDGTSQCVRVARAGAQEHDAVIDLFSAGSQAWSPTVSVAAGPSSALVVMLRVGMPDELVAQAIDLQGNPIASTFVEAPVASPESVDKIPLMDARVVPDGGDGFYVYLGGWGFSMGRMRFDASGGVLEPLAALPPIVDVPVWDVYNSALDGVYPRPGGRIAIGRAVSGGSGRTLLSALSPEGEFAGHVLLSSAATTATATDGERLFAFSVGSGANLYELGCVLP